MEVAVSIINRQKDAKEQEGNGLLLKLTNETVSTGYIGH